MVRTGATVQVRVPFGGRQSSWGSQWSSRQPGRQSGGFGGGGGTARRRRKRPVGGAAARPRTGGSTRGLRWDPTDPLQRRARYSLLSGIWALFFSLFSLPEIALLLGALALYWGISALRGGKAPSLARVRDGGEGRAGGAVADPAPVRRRRTSRAPTVTAGADRPRPAPAIPVGVTPAQAAKSRTTAAISGLITASLALAVVAATFTFQAVYPSTSLCAGRAHPVLP